MYIVHRNLYAQGFTDEQTKRSDFVVRLGFDMYNLYCIEHNSEIQEKYNISPGSEWVWIFRPSSNHVYIYDLPLLENTALMSEEELFQYSLLWNDVYGSWIMDFDLLQAIQKYEYEHRSEWEVHSYDKSITLKYIDGEVVQ